MDVSGEISWNTQQCGKKYQLPLHDAKVGNAIPTFKGYKITHFYAKHWGIEAIVDGSFPRLCWIEQNMILAIVNKVVNHKSILTCPFLTNRPLHTVTVSF